MLCEQYAQIENEARVGIDLLTAVWNAWYSVALNTFVLGVLLGCFCIMFADVLSTWNLCKVSEIVYN